jgi:hypothetical protein
MDLLTGRTGRRRGSILFNLSFFVEILCWETLLLKTFKDMQGAARQALLYIHWRVPT